MIRYMLVATLAACDALPAVAPGDCGNGVVEQGEDCDLIADPGLTCGPSCHWTCEAGARPAACPPGWGCGAGGVCLMPSGQFVEAAGSPWQMPSDSLELGRVDGDSIPDLIGFGGAAMAARLGSGDGRFATETTLSLGFPVGRPAFGAMADGRLVAVAALGATGLVGARATAAGALTPIVFPARSSNDPSGLQLVVFHGVGGMNADTIVRIRGGAMYLFDGDDGPTAYPLPDGHDASELVGAIAVADIDASGDALPGEELVLAFKGAEKLWIYGAARAQPRIVLVPRGEIPLTGRVRSGALFADVDGDGRLDLLVGLAPGGISTGDTVVEVVPATGPATFGAAYEEPGFQEMIGVCGDPFPLAAGDLDGDGRADYVGELGVCASRPAGARGLNLQQVAQNPSPAPWREAVIADFNRDGVNDVAAATGETPGVDFLFADPTGRTPYLSVARAATADPPYRLRVGDFDGDFVPDVAFAEKSWRSGGGGESLSVVFGATAGAPDGAVPMARFGWIDAIDRLSDSPAGVVPDATTDLLVVSAPFPARDGWTMTFLDGSAARRLLSPLTLSAGAGEIDAAQAVALGDFDGDDSLDAVALSSGGPDGVRLWRLRGDGSGGWSAAAPDELPGARDFDRLCALVTIAALPAPTLVGIDGIAGCTGAVPGVRPQLLVATLGATPTASLTPLPGDFVAPNGLLLHDVDRDGALDLIVSFAGDGNAPADGQRVAGSGVVVYLGPAFASGFALDRFRDLDTDAAVFPMATAFLDTRGARDDTLAILTSVGVYLGTVADGALHVPDRPDLAASVTGGSRLIAADLDGDGLDDLVWNGGGQVHVMLARGQNAAGVAAR